MLKAIWEWWNTPMVPRSELIELRCRHIELLTDFDDHKEARLGLQDDNAQLRADIDEARNEREAMRLERDKAVGKFEYVEAAKKELESKLADRDSYVRFLEGQLKQHMDDESDDDETVTISELTCEHCGEGLLDCLCEEEDEEDDDDLICPDCGKTESRCICWGEQ